MGYIQEARKGGIVRDPTDLKAARSAFVSYLRPEFGETADMKVVVD